MKLKTLTLACLLSLAPLSFHSIAAGIPTFDAVALAQSIKDIRQSLIEYEEMLNQTGLNVDQLNGILKSYQQALYQYDHLLAQAQSLKDKLDAKDYLAFLQAAGELESVNPFNVSAKDIRQLLSNTHTKTAIAQTNSMYGAISNRDEYQELLKKTYGTSYISPEELQPYNQANLSVLQNTYNESSKEKNLDLSETINKLDKKRLHMGDESQLATTQLMADQNQVIMRQMQQNNELQRQQIELSNQFENQYYINQQKENERKMKAVIKNANTPVIIDERQLLPR